MAGVGVPPQLPVEHAFSAGGIVVRRGANGPELLLGRRRHRDRRPTWTLPKGTPDGDETPEETALREVSEETGLRVRIVDAVGDIHYRFRRDGRHIDKTVRYYLMEPVGGDLAERDQEFEEVRWFSLAEGEALLRFASERDILARAALPMAELKAIAELEA